MSEIKHMDIVEFWELGYLQEVNRTFLHPLGLALEVAIEGDGTASLSGVWDYRDDPEGVAFDSLDADAVEKAQRIADEWDRRRDARKAALGYIVQPLPGELA